MILPLMVVSLLLVIVFCKMRSGNLPPGPYGLPILGYLPWLDPDDPHLTLTQLSKKYGSIFGLKMGSVYTVVLSDVKLVKKLLAMDATTGRAPLVLTHGIMKGYGLICTQGALWKDQRKFVSSYLRQFGASKSSSKRGELENLIVHHVNETMNFLRNQGGQEIDPADAFYHGVGSIMNQLVLGESYTRDNEFWLWMKHIQEEGIKHFGVAGPVNFLPFLRLLPKYKNVFNFINEGKDRQHAAYQEIITRKIGNVTGSHPENVVEAFLHERSKMGSHPDVGRFYNDAQFHHLLADVFGAGLHTTLTTISWYCLHMAANQDVQKQVHEELDVVLQGRDAILDDQEILPVTMASIAEVQRFNTVVPFGIPHGALEDITIEGYTIPKGSMIVPLQWAIHHDPMHWDEPHKFKLSHFLDSEGKFYKPEAFIPYQTGKRMCVGDELAKMMLFLVIARLMTKFRIVCEKEVNFKGMNSVTYCHSPQKLRFILRNNQ